MSTVVSTHSPSGTVGFFDKLVANQPSTSQLVLRVGLAVMLWPHGAQKLLGWYGGYGFSGTMEAMSMSLPGPIVFLVIIGEFFAPVLLLTGFATRFAAASVALIMAGAAILVHLQNGFFMNWFGGQAGEGIEFHVLAITIAVALVLQGAESTSVDLRLTNRDPQ